jgi:hypothetical protein
MARKPWDAFLDLFEEDKEALVYDPVHLAGLIVGCFAAVGILYWVLWSLLVCQGGLFPKIGALLQILFAGKNLKDFGYEKYPYQLGLFDGWIVNGAALLIALIILGTLWRLYRLAARPRGGLK